MGNVIPLHGDPHDATQQLLPWYVNGTLGPAERTMVDQHLATCADCREELASELHLHDALSALPAPAAPAPWEALRDRAMASATSSSAPPLRPGFWRPGRVAAAIAAQLLVIALGVGVYDRMRPGPVRADYHALSGSAPPTQATAAGNLIVIFRPDVPENAIRATLRAVDARLVDGPTAADAYVLAVPPERRDAALQALRKQADIVLAQPIDTPGNAAR